MLTNPATFNNFYKLRRKGVQLRLLLTFFGFLNQKKMCNRLRLTIYVKRYEKVFMLILDPHPFVQLELNGLFAFFDA